MIFLILMTKSSDWDQLPDYFFCGGGYLKFSSDKSFDNK